MNVYADNAATTAVSATALAAMMPCFQEIYGNPSSLHTPGQRAAEKLEAARETFAKYLNGDPREITFTSGGSEADNQALRSAALLGARKGKKHIISTKFEHHAILHTLQALEKEGFDVTLLDIPPDGVVTAELPITCPKYDSMYRCLTPGIYHGTDGKEYAISDVPTLFAYAVAAVEDKVDFAAYDKNGDGRIDPTELAIMIALRHAERTGEGQEIDISLYNVAMTLMPGAASLYFGSGFVAQRGNNWLTGANANYNIYRTKDDRYVSVGCLEKKFWTNLCRALEREDMIDMVADGLKSVNISREAELEKYHIVEIPSEKAIKFMKSDFSILSEIK